MGPEVFGLLAGLLIFAGLAFFRLGSTTLFVDEATRAWQASLPLPLLISELGNDIQPPLYMMILRGWSLVWGDSEQALRCLSVLIGMAHLSVIWTTWRLLGLRGQKLCMPILVLAAAPAFVDYSRLAFSWPFFAFLVSVIVLFLVRLQQRAKRRDLAALVIVSGAALYTNYLAGVILLGASSTWIAWRRRYSAPGRWCCVWLLVTAILFLPWLPVFVQQWMNDVSDTPLRSVGDRLFRLGARVASIGYQFVLGDSANPGQFTLSICTLALAGFVCWRGLRAAAFTVSTASSSITQLRHYLALHACLFMVSLLTMNFLHGELHFMFTAERLMFCLAPVALVFGLGIVSGRGRMALAITAAALAVLLHWQYFSETSYFNWAYHTHWDQYGDRIAAGVGASGDRVSSEPLVVFDNYAFGRVGERYFSRLGRFENVTDVTHRLPNRAVADVTTSYSTVIFVFSAKDSSPRHFVSRAFGKTGAGYEVEEEMHFLEEPVSWQRLKNRLRSNAGAAAKVICRILQRGS